MLVQCVPDPGGLAGAAVGAYPVGDPVGKAAVVVQCIRAGCKASYPDHKWGSIRAHSDGWWIPKDEIDIYCPDHIPDWVSAWRDAQAVKHGFLNAAHERLLTRGTVFERAPEDG